MGEHVNALCSMASRIEDDPEWPEGSVERHGQNSDSATLLAAATELERLESDLKSANESTQALSDTCGLWAQRFRKVIDANRKLSPWLQRMQKSYLCAPYFKMEIEAWFKVFESFADDTLDATPQPKETSDEG